jgi:hypothetical protein
MKTLLEIAKELVEEEPRDEDGLCWFCRKDKPFGAPRGLAHKPNCLITEAKAAIAQADLR